VKFRLADLFCGAGGTSSGAVEALEALGYRPELTAVNHWPVAIATHEANHPEARTLCTGLDAVNPRDLFEEGGLDLLWASPECTHHSVARGGKPINDQSRATAWCVVRWAEALRPNVILVENVPEFETWGAIGTNGRPLKTKRGATFLAWVGALESLGYRVDWRVLCAADYGDPTTRRRLFVQAVRGRRRIVWPEPTHAPVEDIDLLGRRRPWVAAREVIDWEIPGTSIFERKRPLSPKTMKRIWAGLEKFGLKPFITPGNGERPTQTPRTHDTDAPLPTVTAQGHLHLAEPFIITMEHGGSIRPAGKPLPTITTAKGGAMAFAHPYLIEMRGTSDQQIQGSAKSLGVPLGTVTAGGGHHGMVQPFLVKTANGESRAGEASRALSLGNPMPTVCGTRGDVALVEPHLLPQQSDGRLRPISEPAPTVATSGAIALIEPFLVEYYGNGTPNSVGAPLPTVTCNDRHALVRPVVIVDGERYLLDIRFRMLQPHELAAAQGFPAGYHFTGTKTDQVKQIGNAVPRRLARALCAAVVSQNAEVGHLVEAEEGRGEIERGAA
jgi:DNA (cytosine-5)-methyltransferase 1